MTKLNIYDKVEGKQIDLSLNELLDVPTKELASLPKVTHIDLSCNHIQSIPPQFCSLTHITWLDLSKNQLTELPHIFGNLQQLQYLDLYANKLTTLPVSFCQLKKLRWLDLKDNPLNQNVKSVAGDCLDEKQCLQCAKKIVEYFRIVNSDVERQKQKRLQQEREIESARKAEEEIELNKQKEQKKADKLRRKAALQEKKRIVVERDSSLETDSKVEENDAVNDRKPLQKKRSIFGFMLKWFIFLAVFLPLVAVCSLATYHVFSGKRIESVTDLQLLLIQDWDSVKAWLIATWEIILIEKERLLQFLTLKWRQWYGLADQLETRQDL